MNDGPRGRQGQKSGLQMILYCPLVESTLLYYVLFVHAVLGENLMGTNSHNVILFVWCKKPSVNATKEHSRWFEIQLLK